MLVEGANCLGAEAVPDNTQTASITMSPAESLNCKGTGWKRPGLTMTTIHTIRRAGICLAPLLFIGLLVAQTAQDRVGAIASAMRNQEFARALELLRSALQAYPENAELWAMQGAAYSGEGQKKQALASFRNALKISPDYIPALQGAVQIDYEAGSTAAIPLLRRLLRLRPADRTSHGMLAVLEYRQGECETA